MKRQLPELCSLDEDQPTNVNLTRRRRVIVDHEQLTTLIHHIFILYDEITGPTLDDSDIL